MPKPMSKSDREIKSRNDILAVLSKCDVIRLAINTPGKEYTFTESELAAVCILRLDVTHISGERLNK